MPSVSDIKAGASYVEITTRDEKARAGLKRWDADLDRFHKSISKRSETLNAINARMAVKNSESVVASLRSQAKAVEAEIRQANKAGHVSLKKYQASSPEDRASIHAAHREYVRKQAELKQLEAQITTELSKQGQLRKDAASIAAQEARQSRIRTQQAQSAAQAEKDRLAAIQQAQSAGQSQARGALNSGSASARIAGLSSTGEADRLLSKLQAQHAEINGQVTASMALLRSMRASGESQAAQAVVAAQIRSLIGDRRATEQQITEAEARRVQLSTQEAAAEARITTEKQQQAKAVELAARFQASPLGQREQAAAQMAARSREAAVAQRSLNAALTHFGQVGTLSTATMAKYSSELGRAAAAKRRLGMSAGMANQAIMQGVFLVEDASSVYGTMGFAGAVRAASNNLTMIAMTLGGPYGAAAAVALTATTQLWLAFNKTEDATNSANGAAETYADTLRKTNDAIERQLTLKQRLRKMDTGEEYDREIGDRKDQLAVLDAQRADLLTRQDALANTLPQMRGRDSRTWGEWAAGASHFAYGTTSDSEAEFSQREQNLAEIEELGKQIREIDRERVQLNAELTDIQKSAGPVKAREKIIAEAEARAEKERNQSAKSTLETYRKITELKREQLAFLQQRGQAGRDELDPLTARRREIMAEMKSAIGLIQQLNPANAKELIQLELSLANKRAAEVDAQDPQLQARDRLRDVLKSARARSREAAGQSFDAVDARSTDAFRAVIAATTARTQSPEEKIVQAILSGHKLTKEQIARFDDLLKLMEQAGVLKVQRAR